MRKFILSILSIVLVSNISAQTLLYETGQYSTDPWSGWIADSSANCTGSYLDSNRLVFLFDVQTTSGFASSLTKNMDLTAYSSLKFVYKFAWADFANYQIFVSDDSVTWNPVVQVFGSSTIPTIDSVTITQPTKFIHITMDGWNTSPIVPFQVTSYGYLKIYDMSSSAIEEIEATDKTLVKITDMQGRETKDHPNTLLIYMYSDGTTKKVFRVE